MADASDQAPNVAADDRLPEPVPALAEKARLLAAVLEAEHLCDARSCHQLRGAVPPCLYHQESLCGIEIGESFPWITRVFTYPHGTVRLNFFRVHEWKGEPHPREQQAIAWQAAGVPAVSPMLPANAPVLASLALPTEYAVTDAAGALAQSTY